MIDQLIVNGKLDELKSLLESGEIEKVKNNANLHELASIHIAAQIGNKEIIELLLQEPVNENPNLARINNFTPLHAASMNGHFEIVNYLIQSGADVNIQTEPQGYAPLHSASFGGHLTTIKLLIESGANIKLRNYRNELPIDTARRQNQMEVVNYFSRSKNDT